MKYLINLQKQFRKHGTQSIMCVCELKTKNKILKTKINELLCLTLNGIITTSTYCTLRLC